MCPKHLLIFFLSILTFGCGTDFKQPYSDTPTSGIVSIGADETLTPLATTQKETFMGLYQYAQINLKLASEAESFRLLLADSVKAIIAARELNENEKAVFESKKLIPQTSKFAIDAIALIVSPNNSDSILTIPQLKEILSGKITNWKQLNPKSTKGDITVVFDNNGSSTSRYLKDSLNSGKEFPANCFAAKSNPDVIEYVSKNENAIGVIGVNWISDKDDPKMLSFNKKIKVVWLAKHADAIYPDDYFGPYQAYMYTGEYPLTRSIYIINREGRPGLGTGFASFVSGDQGQRIVRLTGLLPSSPYTRDIQLK